MAPSSIPVHAMKNVDVSAVVTAHREGLLLKPTLDSVVQCMMHANEAGISTELMIVMDRPDESTREMVERYRKQSGASVFSPDTADLGMSRNFAASRAAGTYVAFLDGDDLWGRNWLSAAFNMARSRRGELVLHPEVNVYFGRNPHVFLHIDMEDEAFEVAGLALTNYWTSLCFVSQSLLMRNPYPASNLEGQIGYEDWGWNMACISAGAIHKVVPGTGHAIRMRHVSLLKQTSAAKCMPPSSDLFVQALRKLHRTSASRLRVAQA
jgi:glycosyltransferase involved in cell wall biosynthesis